MKDGFEIRTKSGRSVRRLLNTPEGDGKELEIGEW